MQVAEVFVLKKFDAVFDDATLAEVRRAYADAEHKIVRALRSGTIAELTRHGTSTCVIEREGRYDVDLQLDVEPRAAIGAFVARHMPGTTRRWGVRTLIHSTALPISMFTTTTKHAVHCRATRR